MNPIFEQGPRHGIGHSIDSFINRFNDILEQHIANGRAQSFAFIFYDFTDNSIRRILRDLGVFAKLDRLSGQRLSIFYLHNGTHESIERFNDQFLTALGVSKRVELPCVVFFKLKDKRILDVRIAQLDSSDLIHGFDELYTAISDYLTGTDGKSTQTRTLKWVKSGAKFISTEMFRAALTHVMDGWL